MTRISFISTMGDTPWGGSEYLWAKTAEQALSEGHEVFISIFDWSVSHPELEKLRNQGALLLPRKRNQTLFSKAFSKLSQKFSFMRFLSFKSCYQKVFKCKPDVICISVGGCFDAIFLLDLLDLIYSNSISYILVCQCNNDSVILDDSSRHIARKFFNQAAAIVFVSYHNKKMAERQLAQCLPNAKVLQNPLNLTELTLVKFPPKLTVKFANVARLDTSYKGQDILFEALSSVVWKERDWQCNLYGSGLDENYLHDLAEYYEIADKVNFLGYVNDIRAVWKNNHILLLPSRAEGTPLALVEAMICGRPAVVTDVGGNSEWVKEGLTGFIAEAPTAKSFNQALERAWLEQKNWELFGINAHEYAKSKLDKSPAKSLLQLIINATLQRSYN